MRKKVILSIILAVALMVLTSPFRILQSSLLAGYGYPIKFLDVACQPLPQTGCTNNGWVFNYLGLFEDFTVWFVIGVLIIYLRTRLVKRSSDK